MKSLCFGLGSSSKAVVADDDDQYPSISTLSRKRKGSKIDLTLRSDSSKSLGDLSKSQSDKDKGLSIVPPPDVLTVDIQIDSGENHAKETHTDSEC